MQSDSVYARNYILTQTKFDNYRMPLNKKQTSYIIPIVVHVIHVGEKYGTGYNISDSMVYRTIKGLNDRFKGLIDSTIDVGIQFKLATLSPDGCTVTNGITRFDMRTISTSPDFESAIKSATGWPNTSYYNIWVVPDSKIEDAAFAYYPGGTLNYLDGTMIRNSYFTYSSFVLTHELGHGFNLRHTFEGNCTNSDCNKDGDKVCDTPPHYETGCSSTPSCQDSVLDWDNSRYNYMSYCYNVNRFTIGQKDRMIKSLFTTVRKYLINSKGLDPIHEYNISLSYDNILCDSSLTVNLRNYGTRTIEEATIFWSMIKAGVKSKKWKGSLSSCQEEKFTIIDSLFISETFKSEIKIWIQLSNNQIDSVTSNDSIIVRQGLTPRTYEIGPGSDFGSIAEAVNHIQDFGICGDGSIIFEIKDGSYYEQIRYDDALSMYRNNTITFRAKNQVNPMVFISNINHSVIFELNSCANLRFENLNFIPNKNEETFYGFTLTNNVYNVKWLKCKFISDSSRHGVGIYNNDYHRFNNLVIDSCEFTNLDTGIFLYSKTNLAAPNLTIKNCRFKQNLIAIELAYVSYGIIQNNSFKDIDQYSIKLNNCLVAFSINANLFHGFGKTAILVDKFTGIGYKSCLISNNYFSSYGTVTALESTNSSFVALINNSLNLFDSPALVYNNSTYFESKNNLFRTRRGHCVVLDKSSFFTSDNNNYWLFEGDSFYQNTYPFKIKIPYNLSDWQKLHNDDRSSTYIEPYFQSDSNPSICNIQLDNRGVAISEIKADFFGNIRNNQTPDIGAVEFTSQGIGSFLSDSLEACDSVVITANLPESKYRYNWSNNSNKPVQNVFSNGLNKLTIQDTICGSLFYDSTYVKIREATKYHFSPMPVQCDSLTYDLGEKFVGLEVKWFNEVKASKTTFLQSDSVFFYYRDSTGCKGYSDTVFVQVPKSPLVNLGADQTIDIIDTLILSSGSFPKSVYKWSNGDSSQSLIIPAARLGLGSYRYWLTVTSEFNCMGFDSINIQVVDLGLAENPNDNDIRCYPNPFTDKIHLEFISQNPNDWQVSITDKFGRVVFEKELPVNESVTFNLQDITAGVYLLKIESPKGIVHKLIYKI